MSEKLRAETGRFACTGDTPQDTFKSLDRTVSEAIKQKLVRKGSPLLHISQEFMDKAKDIIRRHLVPEVETDEYAINEYLTPAPLSVVTWFGSRHISPAHQKGLKNAVDFYMPEGTVLRAPASGTIKQIIQDSTERGISTKYWFKGNGIGIESANGEFVWLEHLQTGFARQLDIKVGQEVKAGDVIGISGNTGFTENPHVHMEVLKLIGSEKRAKNYITKKIKFSKNDIPFNIYEEETLA